MSSLSQHTVIAYGNAPNIKDGSYKGFWNEHIVDFISSKIPSIYVDKNIYENGGGNNTRCLIIVKDEKAIVKSFCVMDWKIAEEKIIINN